MMMAFTKTLLKSQAVNDRSTASILTHVNELRNDKISGFDLRILLPVNSDKIAYEENLIDTSLSLEEARDQQFLGR